MKFEIVQQDKEKEFKNDIVQVRLKQNWGIPIVEVKLKGRGTWVTVYELCVSTQGDVVGKTFNGTNLQHKKEIKWPANT